NQTNCTLQTPVTQAHRPPPPGAGPGHLPPGTRTVPESHASPRRVVRLPYSLRTSAGDHTVRAGAERTRPRAGLTALTSRSRTRRLGGPAHMPEAVAQLNQEVAQLARRGRYREALAPAEQACQRAQAEAGPERPEYAVSLRQLADLYRELAL